MTKAERLCLKAAEKGRVSSATYSMRVCNSLAKMGLIQRQPSTWGWFEDRGRDMLTPLPLARVHQDHSK